MAARPSQWTMCQPCLKRAMMALRRHSSPTPSLRKVAYFASSRRLQAGNQVPSFAETSSSELNKILATFREKVFIPSSLPPEQRRIVYQKNFHHLLLGNEPATARIGDEVHELKPISRMKDEPNTRHAIARVLSIMQDLDDFSNLTPFLVGLRSSRRSPKGFQLERIARRLNEKGQQDVLHHCLEHVDRTGASLAHAAFAIEVMRGSIYLAKQGDWSDAANAKALEYAEAVWQLMWDERHVTAKHCKDPSPRKSPEVIGILLLFQALNQNLGPTTGYGGELLRNWRHGPPAPKAESTTYHGRRGEVRQVAAHLINWTIIRASITQALEVTGQYSVLGQALKEKSEKELIPALQRYGEFLEEKKDVLPCPRVDYIVSTVQHLL